MVRYRNVVAVPRPLNKGPMNYGDLQVKAHRSETHFHQKLDGHNDASHENQAPGQHPIRHSSAKMPSRSYELWKQAKNHWKVIASGAVIIGLAAVASSFKTNRQVRT